MHRPLIAGLFHEVRRPIAGISRRRVLRALAIASSLTIATAHAAERPVVAITDATVVDVEHARTIGPRTVLVRDGRIVAIDVPSAVAVPESAERVDGRGRFVIPGLVDMHVHLFNNASRRPPNTWSFPLYVANGVTAVREMAAIPESIAIVNEWRRATADGTLVAPRIVAAGVVAYGKTPEEAARHVDEGADAGADFIKVFSDISESSWRAVIGEAKHRSRPVIGHVPAGVPALTVAAAGQRSDEHLTQLFEACSTIERAVLDERRGLAGDELVARSDAQESRVLAAFDQRTCDRIATALKTTGQVQVPTLVLPYAESSPTIRSLSNDPRWRYLRTDERARWLRNEQSLTDDQRAVAAHRWPVARRIVATLQRAGVPLLAGTDSPMPAVYPGFALHEELELLVRSGLSPAQALSAATLAPAQFLGIDSQAGSVDIGKRADLVVLDGDPLRDIDNTRRIEAVVLDGRLFRRAALDSLLADAAKSAGGD